MTDGQVKQIVEAIYLLVSAIVFHAIASGPSTSGISSALRDIARELKEHR